MSLGKTLLWAVVGVSTLLSGHFLSAQPPARNDVQNPRSQSPRPTEEARQVAQSTNTFAIDLYKKLKTEDENLFFSPASIATALAMTYAGAEGQTERQMAEVLHFRLEEDRLHNGFADFSQILNSTGKGYQLTMANRLWGQKDYPFQPGFLTLTRKAYGAELAPVDFAQSEQARRQINDWVEKQTQGKIEDLIPSGLLDSATRMVLTNAIYFKGKWAAEFSKNATKPTPFHISEGKQVNVPMMHQKESFPYAETGDLKLLELPYGGQDLSMVVLLPKKQNALADLESQLSAESLAEWSKSARKQEVLVFLPRFKMTAEFELAKVLGALGMTLPFSDRADFSGMSSAEDLMISEVLHKAFVEVNEEGTEAAAATGVVVRVTAAPAEPVVFKADHPFLFLIRDNRTGAILFLGRVMNPNAAS